MERTKEYPWGRCASCGYSGNSLMSDHPYPIYDFLCQTCRADLDKEYPWCVDKVEAKTGDLFAQYRHRTEAAAAACLARLNGNPEATEGERFKFVLYKEDATIPF